MHSNYQLIVDGMKKTNKILFLHHCQWNLNRFIIQLTEFYVIIDYEVIIDTNI